MDLDGTGGGGGCWTVQTGPCSTRNTALGNADGSDSLSRHIYIYISRRRCLRL